MIRTFLLILFVFNLSYSQSWNALKITNDTEVSLLVETIENNYGPLSYKEAYFGGDFNWSYIRDYYANALMNSNSTVEFYQNASEFFSSLSDGHVSVTVPSNYSKTIDLEFTMAQRSTIVSYAGEQSLRSCRVNIGDKLVKLNGLSPTKWREILAKYRTTGNLKTDKRYLTLTFTKYSEARGVPRSFYQGDTAELVLDRNGKKFNCSIPWNVSGYPLENRTFDPLVAKRFLGDVHNYESSLFSGRNFYLPEEWREFERYTQDAMGMISLFHEAVKTHAVDNHLELSEAQGKGKGVKTELGKSTPFFKLPSGFQPIPLDPLIKTLVDSTGLVAGTFPRKGKTAGFLRIPSYVPKELTVSLFALRYVISVLEASSDYLIIDQTNNPGGYVVYSDWIIKSLIPEVDLSKHMQFLVRPTNGFLRNFGSLLQTMRNLSASDVPAELKAPLTKYLPVVEESYGRVLRAYNGREFLSEPVSLSTTSFFFEEYLSMVGKIEMIFNPNSPLAKIYNTYGLDLTKETKYTKPKYMMINELDFSGGDATPANLQDYGTVTLVGVNTSGAGGSVGSYQSSLENPLGFRLTESLMFRPSQRGPYQYVENIGVMPDIEVDVTIQDYKNNFSNYFERVLAALRL